MPADNPYRAPEAPLLNPSTGDERFYVVAPTKFLLLSLATLNLYSVYWFYKNWALLNRYHKAYWPVMRGLFPVFFVHSLFDEIDGMLRRKGNEFRWRPRALATTFVVFVIVSAVLDRLAGRGLGSPLTDVLGLACMFPAIATVYSAQQAINAAENDPSGSRNANLTLSNLFWTGVGVLFWLVVLAGLFIGLSETP